MKNDFLTEIKEVKESFKLYAENALQNNWITSEEHTEIINKIENDKLTIGVIGQMKCGKSTFLNALIFKDEILPAATTPMTASLSVITYGEEKKLEAEFYTSEEWETLIYDSSLNVADYENDNNKKSKIKVAKEIIEKSLKISREINRLLGTKKTDVFENLIEYVGADGKYISITKSVRIEYPDEKLKNVEIVDTPGFNDPVVSREERTKDFLKNADVVVMLLYAGRAFDATDKDIIFNKVRTVGVGKILVGVNKYDINYMQGDTEQEIIDNVKEQLVKASEEHVNSSISQLVKEQTPLLLSANMALMSQMELSKVKNGDLNHYYEKALSDFEISTQKEMFQKSFMPQFEEAIRDVIFKSKDEILIRKPINLIKQKGNNTLDELVKNITEVSGKKKVLEMPDDEREEVLDDVKRAKKRIIREVENFKNDSSRNIKKSSRTILHQLEDLLVEYKNKIANIIDNCGAWSEDKLNRNIKDSIDSLERDFNRTLLRYNDKVDETLKDVTNDFTGAISVITDKYLKDFDNNHYFKTVERKIEDFKVVDLNLWDFFPNENSDESSFSLWDVLDFSFVVVAIILRAYTIDKESYRNRMRNFFLKFDLTIIEPAIIDGCERLLIQVEEDFVSNFINPIEEELEKATAEKENDEQKLIVAKENLENLTSKKQILERQIQEMKSLEPIL